MSFSKIYLLISTTLYLICSTTFASEVNLTRSRLIQLALHLEAAESEKQYDFLRIALTEMYDAYQYELERAYTNPLPKTSKKRAKLYRWRRANSAYLATINLYLYELDSGKPLSFFISEQNKVFLLIGDTPIIITGPNSGSDKQIENNIVDHFCKQYSCQEYFSKTHYAKNNKQKQTVKEKIIYETYGHWLVESDKEVIFRLDNGLSFSFKNIKNRLSKESWSLAVGDEAMLLLTSLKEAEEKNKAIDFSHIAIYPLPITDKASKIIINKRNDFLKLPLPILTNNQRLFHALIHWLQSSYEKNTASQITISEADMYYNTSRENTGH